MQVAAAQPSRLTALRVVNVRSRSGNFLRDLLGRIGFEPAVVSRGAAKASHDEATAFVVDWAQAARAKGLEANGIVEVGAVGTSLLKHASSADLLVMGLRGDTEERHTGQGGAMSGWLPPKVDVSILFTIPDGAPLTALALGYDGSEGARHAVREVRRWLGPLGLPVHAIYVSSDGTGGEVLEELADLMPDDDVHTHVVEGEDPHVALVAKAKELGAELLAVGQQGKNAVMDRLFGTSTERILLDGEIDVLVAQ